MMINLLNKIYNEDCLETLKRFDDNFIDLTITSPPYNVNLGNNKYNKTPYNLYNDNNDHKEYINWLENIFKEIYNKTKNGGRCVINIGNGKNGKIPTQSDIIQFMSNIGWLPMAFIIWDKNTTSNRTAWGSFNSPSSPSFPTPFEFILVFAKNSYKLLEKGISDLKKEEFISWSNSKWVINCEKKKDINHPAVFPVELPLRCIKMFSWVDSIVYDPFIGSGTTAVACLKTNRNYIGSEISDEYCEVALNRIKKQNIY